MKPLLVWLHISGTQAWPGADARVGGSHEEEPPQAVSPRVGEAVGTSAHLDRVRRGVCGDHAIAAVGQASVGCGPVSVEQEAQHVEQADAHVDDVTQVGVVSGQGWKRSYHRSCHVWGSWYAKMSLAKWLVPWGDHAMPRRFMTRPVSTS